MKLTEEEQKFWDACAVAVLAIPGRSCESAVSAANKMIRLRREAFENFAHETPPLDEADV